jgi:hypothetical protein
MARSNWIAANNGQELKMIKEAFDQWGHVAFLDPILADWLEEQGEQLFAEAVRSEQSCAVRYSADCSIECSGRGDGDGGGRGAAASDGIGHGCGNGYSNVPSSGVGDGVGGGYGAGSGSGYGDGRG